MELIEITGSPFVENDQVAPADELLLSIYDRAFADRVGLLYLTKYRRVGWLPELENKYQALERRRRLTDSVIATVADVMNQFDPSSYVIFKSLKPFPATPNDTDVLFLKSDEAYEQAYQHLLDSGYLFHEWAPQQRTLYDQRGVGKIGEGKKGGTYYIDFYQEISTDYFAYLNKGRLHDYILMREIEGVTVPLTRPEPELAIVLYHNVFPERTFQLEHFYLPLYYFKDESFDLDLFIHFSEVNHLQLAVRANLSLVAELHKQFFGFVPAPVQLIIDRWGVDKRELREFRKHNLATPYLFTYQLFWRSFLGKLGEWYSLKTALNQLWQLKNPRFFCEVVQSIKDRMGDETVYKLE